MPTCPNGHQSMADDWCEVCGHRVTAAAGGNPPPGSGYSQPPSPGSASQPELCPQCRTPRETRGPFCEECRYNFMTNSPTTYLPPQQAQSPHAGYQQPGPHQGYQQFPEQHFPEQQFAESQPQQQPAHAQYPAHEQAPRAPQQYQPGPPAQPGAPARPEQSGDWLLPPPSTPPAPPGQSADPRAGGYGGGSGGGWLVTIGPDREYFMAMMHRSGPEAAQLSLPAYAPEQQVPLTGRQITIGRRRQSSGQTPDIDLGRAPEDPGVSHQHAILVQQPDGSWAVVDQDSTNGTTVNGSEEPIQPFVPVPLSEGDRVHLGAWTTLTLYRS
ncbi:MULTISPECIES: FHA domain-containing protein [unclassified Streptomyces]|uniref:FHA domain-containing protein n=1 Tax=unclassified Streptomyces TaxID=2593676 RepID=UPI000CD50ED7|nr:MULTISPECIES: FHA domain-containing protein [unclassified Streptomyces]